MQIAGASAKTGGRSSETLEFTACTASGNGESCTVSSSKFTTTPLVNTLGYATSNKGGPVLVLFAPEVGSTVASLKFSGAKCTLLATGLAGNFIGIAQIAGSPVQGGPGTETLHGEVNFAESSKAIWTEAGGSLKETKAKLELAGVAAKIVGLALLQVDEGGSAVKWGISS